MQPTQPNQFDLITLYNPDPHPFELIYDGKSYGSLLPGQQKTYPRFLAEHALKHLIDQCLNSLNIRTNDQGKRNEFALKCVLEEKPIVVEVVKTDAEKLKEQIEELNQPSDLAFVETKRKIEDEAPITPVAPEIPVVEVKQEPVVEAPITPEITQAPVQEEAKPVEDIAPKEITRDDLIAYAQGQGVLDLSDTATMQALQTLPVDEVKTLVQYPN